MKQLNVYKLIAAAGVTAALSTEIALAAAEGDHGLSSLVPYFVNFFVFVTAVYLLTRKMIAANWRKRREALQSGVADAAARYDTAAAIFSGAQGRLTVVEQEMAAAEDSIAAEAVAEERVILEDAEQRVGKILLTARQSADAERNEAQRLLKQELANLVISRARDELGARLSAGSDRMFRKEVARQAEELN